MAEGYYDRTGRWFPSPVGGNKRLERGGNADVWAPGLMSPSELARRTRVEALQRAGEMPYRGEVFPDQVDAALQKARAEARRVQGGGGAAGGVGGGGGGFNNFPSAETTYSGGNDALQREKRLNNYIRAMSLPAQQREAVQMRMEQDPYDRDATMRMERMNLAASADPYQNYSSSQEARNAAALAAWQQQNAQAQAASVAASPRRSQGGGSPFTLGEIPDGNGGSRRAVVPTAGNYNAYREAMAGMGMDESPSPEAFVPAYNEARIDPTKRYESDSLVEAARIAAAGKVAAGQAVQQKVAEQKRIATEEKAIKVSDRLRKANAGNYKGYLQSYQDVVKQAGKDADPEEVEWMFHQMNVPFSKVQAADGSIKFVPLSTTKWRPGLSASPDSAPGDYSAIENAYADAERTPAGQLALRREAESVRGSDADKIYQRAGMGEIPRAPQAPPPAQPLQQVGGGQAAGRKMDDASFAQGMQRLTEKHGGDEQKALQVAMAAVSKLPPGEQAGVMSQFQRYFSARRLKSQAVR